MRLAYGIVAAVALALAVNLGGLHSWQFYAFGAGPDMPLLMGFPGGLARGQLNPRAVPLYNALHRYWGPLLLVLVSLLLGRAWLIGALAWGTHVSVDRALGFGLRNPEGFQRVG